MSVPTGLAASGSPVTNAGTIAISYANGYSIPTDAKQSTWDDKMGPAITTAPTADAPAGQGMQIVVLDTPPATYYNGYIYLITE